MATDLPKYLLKLIVALLKHQAETWLGKDTLGVAGQAIVEIGGEKAQEKIDEFLKNSDTAQQILKAAQKADSDFRGKCTNNDLRDALTIPLGDLPSIQSAIKDLPKSIDEEGLLTAIKNSLTRDFPGLTRDQIESGSTLYLDCLTRALMPLKEYTLTIIGQNTNAIKENTEQLLLATKEINEKLDTVITERSPDPILKTETLLEKSISLKAFSLDPQISLHTSLPFDIGNLWGLERGSYFGIIGSWEPMDLYTELMFVEGGLRSANEKLVPPLRLPRRAWLQVSPRKLQFGPQSIHELIALARETEGRISFIEEDFPNACLPGIIIKAHDVPDMDLIEIVPKWCSSLIRLFLEQDIAIVIEVNAAFLCRRDTLIKSLERQGIAASLDSISRDPKLLGKVIPIDELIIGHSLIHPHSDKRVIEIPQQRDNSGQSNDQQSAANEYEDTVFVSYARESESMRIVDEMEKFFAERGIRIARDIKDIDYKDSIEAFEQRIGRGQCIIIVISDKYLHSKHCMHELVEVDKNREVRKRIFPIVLPDAKISDAVECLGYIQYWDGKINELNQAIKQTNELTGVNRELADLKKYKDIRDNFDHLTDLLSDMYVQTPEMLAASGYSKLISGVESVMIRKQTSPQLGNSLPHSDKNPDHVSTNFQTTSSSTNNALFSLFHEISTRSKNTIPELGWKSYPSVQVVYASLSSANSLASTFNPLTVIEQLDSILSSHAHLVSLDAEVLDLVEIYLPEYILAVVNAYPRSKRKEAQIHSLLFCGIPVDRSQTGSKPRGSLIDRSDALLDAWLAGALQVGIDVSALAGIQPNYSPFHPLLVLASLRRLQKNPGESETLDLLKKLIAGSKIDNDLELLTRFAFESSTKHKVLSRQIAQSNRASLTSLALRAGIQFRPDDLELESLVSPDSWWLATALPADIELIQSILKLPSEKRTIFGLEPLDRESSTDSYLVGLIKVCRRGRQLSFRNPSLMS